jgi:hypothetical protein
MILKDLQISLEQYGSDKGTYQGKIVFTDKTGEIKIRVTPEQCHKIFEICADALVEQAQKAANIMVATVIETKQIEGEE